MKHIQKTLNSYMCIYCFQNWTRLTVTTLKANSADNKLTFFLFFPENKLWHFMQIVSWGDNLHEMSKAYFLGKKKKKKEKKIQNVCWSYFPSMLSIMMHTSKTVSLNHNRSCHLVIKNTCRYIFVCILFLHKYELWDLLSSSTVNKMRWYYFSNPNY